MWFIYTIEYYSVTKRKNILKFASKWMELAKIILNELVQTQKNNHVIYAFVSDTHATVHRPREAK